MQDNKYRKEIGFIKNHSSKKLLGKIKQIKNQESSDSFSSFQYNKKADQDDFSPYKHPITTSHKKQSQNQFKQERTWQIQPPKFTNEKLKNNFVREQPLKYEKSQMKNERNLKEILKETNNQQNYLRINAKPMFREVERGKSQSEISEEELSLSNINQFKEIVSKNQPISQIHNQKHHYQASNSSESDDIENFQNRKNINYMKPVAKRTNLGKMSFPEQVEQLITDYNKKEFAQKGIKKALQMNNRRENRDEEKESGLFETKGGVCFQLDVNDFHGASTKRKTSKSSKIKPSKIIDSKEQLLRRRQMAKIYDRQTRFKMFGYN